MGDDLCVAQVQEWADGLADLHALIGQRFARSCATNDEGAVDVCICGAGVNAVQVIEVGPPESSCRGWFQTTVCCAG